MAPSPAIDARPGVIMNSDRQDDTTLLARITGRRALDAAACALAAVALVWMGYQFWRLVFQRGVSRAVDLHLRHGECQEWFEGVSIYATRVDAVYPPATYVMLWPLLGWLEWPAVRVFWCLVTLLSIVWMCRLAVTYGEVTEPRRRRLLWLMPLACYPVGATVGNGQISILVVACLFAGLMLLARERPSWRRDLTIAVLMLGALMKPSVSAFFFWILVFAPGGLRAACLVGTGYVALTYAASLAQDSGPIELMDAWLERARAGMLWGSSRGGGAIVNGTDGLEITGINLASILSVAGSQALTLPVTVAALALLGAWILWRRRARLLSLLGVTAIVARFSVYHGWYDDVLMLIPLVALIAWARGGASARSRAMAGWLSLGFGLSLLAPGGIYSLPRALANAYAIGQSVCWLAGLVFLAWTARSPVRDRRVIASE